MGGRVVDQTSLPLSGRRLDDTGIVADPDLSDLLRSVLVTLSKVTQA